MGLMDRDYWRDKHNPGWDRKTGKRVDLAGLQRGLDKVVGVGAERGRRSGVPIWLAVLVWIVVALALFATLRALGVGRH